jgi:hypothetical protein
MQIIDYIFLVLIVLISSWCYLFFGYLLTRYALTQDEKAKFKFWDDWDKKTRLFLKPSSIQVTNDAKCCILECSNENAPYIVNYQLNKRITSSSMVLLEEINNSKKYLILISIISSCISFAVAIYSKYLPSPSYQLGITVAKFLFTYGLVLYAIIPAYIRVIIIDKRVKTIEDCEKEFKEVKSNEEKKHGRFKLVEKL